ncbi:hypothetical protein ACIQYL_20175 [Lysinibacillus xylanilyticus]|uniref:hypothetical protein n=1 Tax=Lysinibacillus xylanilyticus TaxID=582475 RepID=UPI0038224DDF
MEKSTQEAIQKEADALAVTYQENEPHSEFNDCVEMVKEGIIAAAAAKGASAGPWGAAAGAVLGAGGEYPAARLACGKITHVNSSRFFDKSIGV